jgi:hypothetical protein
MPSHETLFTTALRLSGGPDSKLLGGLKELSGHIRKSTEGAKKLGKESKEGFASLKEGIDKAKESTERVVSTK